MKKVLSVILLMAVLVSFATAEKPEAEKKLTLQDAILIALKNNLDLQIQKSNTQISLQDLKISQAIYVPNLNISGSTEKQLQPSTDINEGVDTKSNRTDSLSIRVSQRVPFLGGTVTFGLTNFARDTNVLNTPLNPYISAYAGATYSQPLLKNFGKLATNYNIYIADNRLKSSKLELQEQIATLVYNVEQAYWQLVLAYQELETTKMALKLSKDLLKQNEIKVKVGTAAPIEILSSKAQVAQNESNLISAEQTIQLREEALKKILNLSKDPSMLFPIDSPQVKKFKADFDDYLVEALQNRLDMKRAKIDLENQNITVKYYKNQALPNLRLETSFSSYGGGGTFWDYPRNVSPFDPSFYRTKILERTLWDAWGDVFKFSNKNYSIQLTLNMPIGFKAERANLAKSRIQLDQSLKRLRNTENTVYSEVKQVIKKLESNKKLVESTKIAEELQLETLKAEEKKLSVGISTNFEVLTTQERYANSQVSALRSVINYVLTIAEINKTLNRTFKVYNINFSDFYSNK